MKKRTPGTRLKQIVKKEFAPARVLVPLDFSELSCNALSRGAGMAAQFNSSLLLIHVVEPIIYPVDYMVVPKEMEEGNLVLFQKAREELHRLRDQLTDQGLNAEVDIRMGKPHVEITEMAKKKKIDLIVIGTHGRTGLKQWYLGSTAERVVRHAPCPVLVVR